MTLYNQLPPPLRKLLEKHGIENNSIHSRDGHLIIEPDDLEVAFELRETTLKFLPCCLISHNGKPALQISLNQNNTHN